MKKIIFICVFFLSIIFVSGEERPARLRDEANLLTDSEQELLETKLDEISERQQCDVAIITVNSTNGKDIVDMADDIYDYDGYGMGPGDDGILFLLDMGNREWAISTYGFAIDAFTDVGQERLMDRVVPYLSSGNFNKAFNQFASLCDDYITEAKNGDPIGAYTPPSSSGNHSNNNSSHQSSEPQKLDPFSLALICGGVSLFIALGTVLSEKGKLKSVRTKSTAYDYVSKPLYLTRSQDLYLYRNVTRRAKPKPPPSSSSHSFSSTHRSSSGRSHGGSRGSF